MYTYADATIRDAQPQDLPLAAGVLTDASVDGRVACWAESELQRRRTLMQNHFTLLLEHAITHANIRLAITHTGNTTVAGVAVWYPHPLLPGACNVHDIGKHAPTDDPAAIRLASLQDALRERHPTDRHHYLACHGVTPTAQNHGIGTALLAEHIGNLDRSALPAYLEADDRRNRALYTRLGFRDRGRPVTVASSPPVWPMWRTPATTTA